MSDSATVTAKSTRKIQTQVPVAYGDTASKLAAIHGDGRDEAFGTRAMLAYAHERFADVAKWLKAKGEHIGSDGNLYVDPEIVAAKEKAAKLAELTKGLTPAQQKAVHAKLKLVEEAQEKARKASAEAREQMRLAMAGIDEIKAEAK